MKVAQRLLRRIALKDAEVPQLVRESRPLGEQQRDDDEKASEHADTLNKTGS